MIPIPAETPNASAIEESETLVDTSPVAFTPNDMADPSRMPSTPPITVTGTGTGSSQYDNRGRYIFGGVTLKY